MAIRSAIFAPRVMVSIHETSGRPVERNFRRYGDLSPRFEIDAEFSAAAFYGCIVTSFGNTYYGFHLKLIFTLGDIVDKLLDDAQAFQDLLHADHIAGEAVALGEEYLTEIHFAVHGIGMPLAHVAGPARCTAPCRP